MKDALKKFLSKRVIIIVLSVLLVLSLINTYLIFEGGRTSFSGIPANYDYVLSQVGNNYSLKNMLAGHIEQPATASLAINSALAAGKSLFLNPGTYVLTEKILISNKVNSKLISDGSTI